ncbi:NACHT domain-containing NTPase [Synechocystis sp. PCC 7339]|uniref:NACHT domain-containing protein n=1 Tax=Synechocystis sp. PCC 7339 TaxID=2782213 RepID=UPI001CBD7715|nr:NACHT domain-containing NTPase [Synechocystis sp. PCC 7339]
MHYELAPLRRIDVINAVEAEGFSSDDFLKAINQRDRDIVPLAIKPISLRFLLNTYRRHKSQFPLEQKRYEFYLEGCKCLCEEVSKCRHALKETGNLDIDQRLIIAARIAAVTIFTNQFAVWTGVGQEQVPAEDVPLQKLCFGCEGSNGKEFEVTQEVIKEVLDNGLFSSRGSDRMGWAHQTYAEFLAAWYLTQKNIDLSKIKALFYSSADSNPKLIPQLHETAAWLASMRNDVFEEIIRTDPDVLLQTDIPTDSELRASIVASLLAQYEEEKLFDRGFHNVRNYAKLKHSELAEQLKAYICDSSKKEDTRRIAIDIAIECNLSELQDELADLALDLSQPISARVNAARAISSIGDLSTKLRLKPLVLNALLEDEEDELKAYALKALWPRQLTAEELFQALTPPKRINLLGMHRYFLESELVPQLDSEDLVIALDWLKTQGVRCFGHPFEELGDAILLKAWEHFDIPGVLEGFTQVALLQWKEHQKIISHSPSLQAEFQESLLGNNQKRYALIENLVEKIAEKNEDKDFYFLTSSMTESIVSSNDVSWMLEKLQDSNDETKQRMWAKLIKIIFDRRNTGQIIDVIEATKKNSILSTVFYSDFAPIELDSEEATQLRDHYFKMRNSWNKPNLLDPPPKERVIDCLEQLESGDLSAWWRLNREMTLLPQSKRYGHNLELDLTQLPGWKEAEQATKKRIIQGAIQYIQQQTDIDYSWIGTNTYNFSELYGCKALQLILTEAPRILDNFSTDIWKRWTPIILSVPNSFIDSNPRENCRKLVSLSYHHSPDEFLTTLLKLIDKKIKIIIFL